MATASRPRSSKTRSCTRQGGSYSNRKSRHKTDLSQSTRRSYSCIDGELSVIWRKVVRISRKPMDRYSSTAGAFSAVASK